MVRTLENRLRSLAVRVRSSAVRSSANGGAAVRSSAYRNGSERVSGARSSGAAEPAAIVTFAGLALVLLAAAGCESGGVGDPCIPEDEFFEDFNGFAVGEVNVESRSFQCETRVCLVNKFQGRVSCPYGTNGTPPVQTEGTPTVTHNLPCEVPQFGGYVTAPVLPQLVERSPEVSVYCSCRCDGADPNARYCECPSGFECAEIVTSQTSQNTGQAQLAGSYCIRSGSDVDPITIGPEECSVPAPGTPAGPNDLTCGTPPEPI